MRLTGVSGGNGIIVAVVNIASNGDSNSHFFGGQGFLVIATVRVIIRKPGGRGSSRGKPKTLNPETYIWRTRVEKR